MTETQLATKEDIARHAMELLLASISKHMGDDGLISKFLFGKPGAPIWDRRLGIEIFYSRKKLLDAVLFIRKHGPHHLRQMAVGDIQSVLTQFVVENYWCLADETMFSDIGDRPFTAVAWQTKNTLAAALVASTLFTPEAELTLYPLQPIQVNADFECPSFFFLKPASLTHARLGIYERNILANNKFPPLRAEGRKDEVSAWLGVRSPAEQISAKMKAVILGALALKLPLHERKMFSGRMVSGGRCTINKRGITESFGPSHVPPLMHDIAVEASDRGWLSRVDELVASSGDEERKYCRALEYFYRAWPLDPRQRFPLLFMALDSVFGDAGRATQAVLDALMKYGETQFPPERLRLLFKLRGSVIHGGAPDVYDADKYHRYLEAYGDDPITDIELIAATCFRSGIFNNKLVERPDNREAIRRTMLEQRERSRKV